MLKVQIQPKDKKQREELNNTLFAGKLVWVQRRSAELESDVKQPASVDWI